MLLYFFSISNRFPVFDIHLHSELHRCPSTIRDKMPWTHQTLEYEQNVVTGQMTTAVSLFRNLFFFCISGDIWICLFERTSRVHSCGWSQSSCPSMQWAFFVFLTLSVCYIPGFAVSCSDIPNSLSSKISFYVPWDTWWQSAFHNYLTYQVVQKAKLTL